MPRRERFAGVADSDRLITERDLPGIGQVISHNAFDKRAFPRAVTAQKRVHRSRPDRH